MLRIPCSPTLVAFTSLAAILTACGSTDCPAGTIRQGNICRLSSGDTATDGGFAPMNGNGNMNVPQGGASAANGGGMPKSGTTGSGPNPAGSASGAPVATPGTCPGGGVAIIEVCDNKDNDCDGKIDETVEMACGGSARAPCKMGKKTCVAGAWSACVGAVDPLPEVCDASDTDENCDGVINEGCACTPNAMQMCGSKEGTCKPGMQTCGANGMWGTDCVGGTMPQPEVCDGQRDEDCDGQLDASDSDCECVAGMTTDCVAGQGICAPGKKSCVDGKWATECVGPKAKKEVCDGMPIDEDCDGDPDNGCACTEGMMRKCPGGNDNTPCMSGMQKCVGGQWNTCTGRKDPASSETCNNIDDNCDGQIDVGATCGTGSKCVNGDCKEWCTDASCKAMNTPCTTNRCDQSTGQCTPTTLAPNAACSEPGAGITVGYCDGSTCKLDSDVVCDVAGLESGQWTVSEMYKVCQPNNCLPNPPNNSTFGPCRTAKSRQQVMWEIFDDYQESNGIEVASVTVGGKDSACSGSTCKKWFGNPHTKDSRIAVTCSIFDDYSTNSVDGRRQFLASWRGVGHPANPDGRDGASVCTPEACRKWVGACRLQ